MNNEKHNTIRLSHKIFVSLGPSILIISNIFLFGPFTMYQGNMNEFVVPFTTILKCYLLPALVSLIVLNAIGLLLPKKLHQLYIAALFVVGLLIWLQGNILVWDYGVVGKGDIDWTKKLWRGWIDGTLWVLVVIMAFLGFRKIYAISTVACIIFFSLQSIFLTFTSLQHPKIWKDPAKLAFSISPPREIFEFSSKENVIHVILDELESDIFQEIIDQNAEYYYRTLDGFTFFREATGTFPTTIMSVPAFLTGKIYNNDVTTKSFLNSIYKGRTTYSTLLDNGYDVDLVGPFDWFCRGVYSNCFSIPVPYGVSKKHYERANSAFMLNLVLFRHTPHFIKKVFHNNSAKVLFLKHEKRKGKKTYQAERHFAHKAFLQDIIENMSVNRNKPVYKLFHFTTTHWPVVLNEDCEYAGEILPWTWRPIKIQAKCSFDHFLEFLERLKSIGVYDSSLILIHADHGYWHVPESFGQVDLRNLDKPLNGDFRDKEHLAQVVASSVPLLAIKPPYSKGPLKISRVQAMLTDIPATISSLLSLNEEFPGRSVFEISPHELRERKFIYYDKFAQEGDVFFDRMDVYTIKGSAFDRASWHFVKTLLGYEKPPLPKKYQVSKIDLGTDEVDHFLRFGWSGKGTNEGLTYTWALADSASIFLSLPKNEAVVLTANVKSPKFSKPQQISIKVDGNEIGGWELSPSSWNWKKPWSWEKKSILIHPDARRPDVSVIEFIFSQYRKPDELDSRPLAVLFESITLSEPEYDKKQ